MPNRLYNKQVSPKGYMGGGSVKRVARDKGTPKSGEKGFKHKGTLQKIEKKIFGKKKKRYDRSDAKTDAQHPAVAKELKKKGLTSKKVEEDILKEEMKSYMSGGRVKKKEDIRDKRAAKSQKKTYDAITGSLNKATLGLTNPKKFKIIDKLNIFKKKK